MSQVDRDGGLQIEFARASLDLSFQFRDFFVDVQIEESMRTFLANRPRRKVFALNIGHLILAVDAKAQRFCIALDDFDRDINGLLNRFRSDLYDRAGTACIEHWWLR